MRSASSSLAEGTTQNLPMKKLELYTSYNREEIHDILSPNTKFTKSAGTWGLQGLVRIDNSKDFVFMVTEGTVTAVSKHEFDEGFTGDGVFRWQSQPQNTLKTQKIIDLINHDEISNNIVLQNKKAGPPSHLSIRSLLFR